MRKPIIAANWKMHKTLAEAESFVEELKGRVPAAEALDTVICASALFLEKLVTLAKDTDIKIGAQTMHFEDEGAFTGEISPVALKDLNVDYVIIGHSERRQLFAETDETVNKKVIAALKHQLLPIVCVGETLAEREAGKTNEVVTMQVEKALQGVDESRLAEIVIAYEPIWAIGSGKASTAEDANDVCRQIRAHLAAIFHPEIAEQIRIQYGGSVKPGNINELLAKEHIDGALVGGASLEVQSFLQLLEAGKDGE